MKKLQCEICGGSLTKTEEGFICINCGCLYSPEAAKKMVLEIDGPVTVSGIADANQLIENAKTFLRLGRFNEAKAALDKAIELAPSVAEAYYLRLVVEKRICDENGWESIRDAWLESHPDFASAKALADAELDTKLHSISEANWKNILQDELDRGWTSEERLKNCVNRAINELKLDACKDLAQQCLARVDRLEDEERARAEKRAEEERRLQEEWRRKKQREKNQETLV